MNNSVVTTERSSEMNDDESFGFVVFGEDEGRDSEFGGASEGSSGEGVVDGVVGESGVGTWEGRKRVSKGERMGERVWQRRSGKERERGDGQVRFRREEGRS